MSYQASNGPIILGEWTRRSFAEGMRGFANVDVPLKSDLDSFDRWLKLRPSKLSTSRFEA